MAAMLSQIGCVSIPEDILSNAYQGKELSANEQRIFDGHPSAGRQLIENIPRLERVAEIIGYQRREYDGYGHPRGEEIPLGGRVLKAALDFDTLLSAGYTNDTAMAEMNDRTGWYDPTVLAALRETLVIRNEYVIRRVKVADLVDGLTLADDIVSIKGMLLCAKGQEVTRSMRLRLRNYVNNIGIRGPVKVFVPQEMAARFAEEPAAANGA
jgi:HD-GYP domain-containing protein (c-di-GMP phosphodiesterase class II)